jgi:hypothetical protein
MQIPAGPNQVAQAYQGNPAALQANIQKDQQQKPNLGPDLVKLLALGTVTSEKDNASKAQALQQLQGLMAQSPTGKPPTVFEQIQRKAAQMTMGLGQAAQPQAQPQGLPAALQEQGQEQEQPEQAQGIDQLPADFEFAGGGIVAFSGGGSALDELYNQGIDKLRPLADKYKQEEAQFLAAAQSGDSQAIKTYMDAKEATRQSLESQVGKQFGNAASKVMQTLFAPATSAKTPDTALAPTPAAATPPAPAAVATPPAPAAATPPKLSGGITESPLVQTSAPAAPAAPATSQKRVDGLTLEEHLALGRRKTKEQDGVWTEGAEKRYRDYFNNAKPDPVATKSAAPKPAPAATAPAPTPTPTAPKPTIVAPQQGIKQQQATEPADPMEASIRKSITDTLAEKPDDVYKAAAERNSKLVGLDDLLKEKEGRIASTEALLKKQQAGRLPLWVTQLQEFSAANPRAGLGAQLGASGAGAAKARAGYEAEDRAYNAEINKLRDSVLQAKIEGRYKDAAAGENAIKDLTANRRQAESSGTSLLNTQATVKSTAESKRQHEERMKAEAGARAEERKRQFDLGLEEKKNKRQQDMEKFIQDQERKQNAFILSSQEYKNLLDLEKRQQYLLISPNQKTRENAEAELQRISEKKADLLAKNASGASAKAPKAPATTDQDKDAVAWAKANPNDPRAAKILELNK